MSKWTQRKMAREEIKARLAERRTGFQCRSHLKGRCTNGANCPAPHITDPAEITCNSMRTAEDAGESRAGTGRTDTATCFTRRWSARTRTAFTAWRWPLPSPTRRKART